MAFDQTSISEVAIPRYYRGQVFLAWTSSAPIGTPFQIYVDGELTWHGTARSCWLPIPSGPSRVDIGAVGIGEERIDWSQSSGYGAGQFGLGPYAVVASLPSAPARRAQLSWTGGSYLGSTLAGFHVYGESSPGSGINYATPLATITAFPSGIPMDGFGLGAFGSGVYGSVVGTYSWTSEPLAVGTWHFAVRSFDTAGNEGTASVQTVIISGPPTVPGLMADGVTRLNYSLSGFGAGGFGGSTTFGSGTFGSGGFGGGYPFGMGAVTLTWNPSP